MKISKAEEHEKRQWKEAGELYPLHGYVQVRGTLGGSQVGLAGSHRRSPGVDLRRGRPCHTKDFESRKDNP